MKKELFKLNRIKLTALAGWLALAMLSHGKTHGQSVFKIEYSKPPIDVEAPLFLENPGDSITLRKELKKLTNLLQSSGHLTAGIDSMLTISHMDTSIIKVYVGPKFEWGLLRAGDLSEEMLSKVGFRKNLTYDLPLKNVQINQLIERLLTTTENTGHPFAKIYLENATISGDSIQANLYLDKGELFLIDSLIFKGELNTNRKYLENYLGIKKGTPYNQSNLRRIPNRINEIPFIQSIKPYEVGMRPGKTDVYFYLKPKKSSNFDGILGVLPDPETGEILFTGDIKLNLLNSFKKGETINLEWQRLQTQTSQLDVRFIYPFIFSTPIGLDFKFNLYRQDTTFSQNRISLGLEYYFLGNNRIRIFFENQGANTIGSGDFIADDLADSRTNLFGLGANLSQLDYKFNPRKGFLIDLSAAAGRKEISAASSNTENSETDIFNLNLNASTFVPIFQRSTLLFKIQGGAFVNENMFRNEVYRIGGLRTMRGFDEQSIFASTYAVGTLEYRFILEQNSNLFLFLDQGIYEDQSRKDNISDTPLGFGGGINFETGAGVFSLTYALGRQFDNNFSVRGGKIHFGFISFF